MRPPPLHPDNPPPPTPYQQTGEPPPPFPMPQATAMHPSRRRFIQLAGLSVLATPLRAATKPGANDTVRIGLIGCGGRGTSLAEEFNKIKGLTIAALCDPDTQQIDRIVAALAKKEVDLSKATRFQDYRKLDRKSVV